MKITDYLSAYKPPEINDVCDGERVVFTREGPELRPRKPSKREIELKRLVPGILLGIRPREDIKYKARPGDAARMRGLLDTAWAHYSRHVQEIFIYRRRGKFPTFRYYLSGYLVSESWFDRIDEFSDAARKLRTSLGLPADLAKAGGPTK